MNAYTDTQNKLQVPNTCENCLNTQDVNTQDVLVTQMGLARTELTGNDMKK